MTILAEAGIALAAWVKNRAERKRSVNSIRGEDYRRQRLGMPEFDSEAIDFRGAGLMQSDCALRPIRNAASLDKYRIQANADCSRGLTRMDSRLIRFASRMTLAVFFLVVFFVSAWPPQAGAQRTGGFDATVVKAGELVPPRVAAPCSSGACPFAGQTVTMLLYAGRVITQPVHELKSEFEAATGARLVLVEVPYSEHFSTCAPSEC